MRYSNRNLYASLFDFTDPWKIDIMGFMEQNYMNDLTLEEILLQGIQRTVRLFARSLRLLDVRFLVENLDAQLVVGYHPIVAVMFVGTF